MKERTQRVISFALTKVALSDTMTVVMYSKDSCPFCERAKALLTEHNYQYVVKNVVNPTIKAELLERFPEARTVPQIFFGDTHIGGYTELKSYLEQSL